MKKQIVIILMLCFTLLGWSANKDNDKVVVAYITSWTRVMPDPTVMTHINYAFGHVKETFDGVRIDNEERLRKIVALKKQNPDLKVMLSVGGWGSGHFSEMAASDVNRQAFAKDCRRVCNESGLDGIDIDWEYPTQSSANISSSPDDTKNFTLLMRDLRKALGSKRLLTIASVSSAQFIDFKSCIKYLNFVNVMAYDMANAPKHHAALYPSEISGWNTTSGGVEAHRKAGVPDNKIVLGMPFYGRGVRGKYLKYADRAGVDYEERWHEQSQASYLVDKEGKLVFGIETPRSISVKCAYIYQQGLHGAMYWEYADDNRQGDLQRAVWKGIHQQGTPVKRLVAHLTESQKREEVTPDSFYYDVQELRLAIERQSDPASKAICQAALAHLLCLNAYRAQDYDRKTESPIDSIQEWTTREYQQHAAHLYEQSLQDVNLLLDTPTSDWLPAVTRGKDEKVFHSSMFYVIWNAMSGDLSEDDVSSQARRRVASAITTCRSRGYDEGALRLTLDTLQKSYHGNIPKDTLLYLMEAYQATPACALVYVQLADQTDSILLKRQYLEEALRRYPKCQQKSEIKNRLLELQAPYLNVHLQGVYYPFQQVKLPLDIRNMQSATIQVYQLPAEFAESRDSLLFKVRKQGRLIRTLPISFATHPAWEQWHDSLTFAIPDCGNYAVVLNGTTTAKLEQKSEADVSLFRVTRLRYMVLPHISSVAKIAVVDAETGEPQRDVTMDIYQCSDRYNNGKDSLVFSCLTDGWGIVSFQPKEKNAIYKVRVHRTGDEALQRNVLNLGQPSQSKDREVDALRIFTDRGIYRPGQKVYVSAVSYKQKGWDAKVQEGSECTLTLRDANHQKLLTHTLRTDEFGVLQDSLQLPEGGLPGTYDIQIANARAYIKVEEYRRPTFYVEFQKHGECQDSLYVIHGKAISYSGAPVAKGRVTGTYCWSNLFRFYNVTGYLSIAHLDTIYTDASGCFTYTIPLKASREIVHFGLSLNINVDVLSPNGETHHAQNFFSYSTRRLFLTPGELRETYYKENPPSWQMNLTSSTGEPVDGTVQCQLLQKDVIIKQFQLKANQKGTPQETIEIPSGEYLLKAFAEVNGDTASWQEKIVVHSMQDMHLTGHHPLFLNTADSKFAKEAPARFQIGSTLKDAWIYCQVICPDTMLMDTLLHVSDRLQTFTIPYMDEQHKSIIVKAQIYSKGQSYDETLHFCLQQPDITLRTHWDTFRDRLQPGQKETWKLTLQHPDGTPARANLMLALYDASLDALRSNSWNFVLYRGYDYPYTWWSNGNVGNSSSTLSLAFSQRYFPTREYEFSSWNHQYFGGMGMDVMPLSVGRNRHIKIRGSARVSDMVFDCAPLMAKSLNEVVPTRSDMVQSVQTETRQGSELEGQIGGLELENDTYMENMPLRSNLQETAFFYPTLRTDENGGVSINFTLPESMTSWHLLGFAHTKDLQTAIISDTIVAQKDLMAELALPRYLRDGDEAVLTASIRNISDQRQTGRAMWLISNADNKREVKKMTVRFDLPAHTDSTFYLPLKATSDVPLLIVQWSAKGTSCSDGEQRYLPVLSQLQNITETRTYMLKGDSILHMDLTGLFAHDNPNATGRSLTVEHVAQPMLLALQSLPSMMAPTCQDALSLTTTYYAGSVAYMIANHYPDVRNAISQWAKDEKALESPLLKNEELTGILMQETPWVADAKQQTESQRRLSSLLDDMSQLQRKMTLFNALSQLQQSDGSFAWYPGMKGSRWVTTEVAVLLTRLQRITNQSSNIEREMLTRAVRYLASGMKDYLVELKKDEKAHLSMNALQYLYVVLFSDNLNNVNKSDVDYLVARLKKQAQDYDREERALVAALLKQSGEEKIARSLMPRLHQLVQHHDGMYLAYQSGSFTCIDRKIQNHVQLMEAIRQVEPEDSLTVGSMAEWLIKQKRTQEWDQPVQSADAVYALMQTGMSSHPGDWRSKVTYDNQEHILKSPKPFIPYVRERIDPISHPKQLYVEQKNTQGGLAWGAVFAQYQLPALQVEKQRQGMTIRRDVQQASSIAEGDRLHVRYTITVDTDYEYVTLRSPRPASAEPAIQNSGYHWQGVGYYQALHDASTDYFFDALPRGTYVIEEDWLLNRSGNYVLPSATLQCVYAPEFQSHTAGERFFIEKRR